MNIYLKSMHLENFRGYVHSTIIFDQHMNVIVGKNDVGKSTILDALEIFFNNDQIKIEPGDRNVLCSGDEKVEITCCFALDDEAKVIIDTSAPTRLDKEFLLNSEGLLEISKSWDCSKRSVGPKDLKILIIANYPEIGSNPLV